MNQRIYIPWTIFGLLIVLSIGSALFALSESPGSAQLHPNSTVSNASKATYGSHDFSAISSESSTGTASSGQNGSENLVFQAPSKVIIFPIGSSESSGSTYTGKTATHGLNEYACATTSGGWVFNGQAYTRRVSSKSLAECEYRAVGAANAPTTKQSIAQIKGYVDETVTVSNGYLKVVRLYVVSPSPQGNSTATETLHFTKVNGTNT